jgi:hypothetical protein
MGLQGSLLQIDVSEIVAHEADDPNSVVDLLDADASAGKHGRGVDLLSMPHQTGKPQASPPAAASACPGLLESLVDTGFNESFFDHASQHFRDLGRQIRWTEQARPRA